MFTSRLSRTLALTSASVLAMSAAAFAQSTETVVVTGSRVIQDVANSPTPVTIVSTSQLLETTPSNLSDALNKLPVFQNSATSRNAGSASGNSGGSFLNLRNFGQQRTLTLLDGMRQAPANQGGSVDISVLPQTLVSRVDVVTAGASSVYGSDAVTGVVNFVLDKNFNGIKYDINSGISMYADGFKYKAAMAVGTDIFGGKGHIEGSFSYQNEDGVLKPARPSGAKFLSSYNTGSDPRAPVTNITNGGQTVSTASGKITCSNCTVNGINVNGYEFVSPGVLGPINYGIIPNNVPVTQAAGVTAIPANTAVAQNCIDCAHTDYTSIFGDNRMVTLFGRFSYKLNEDTMFFAQLQGAQSNVFNYFFPMQQEDSRQTTTFFKNNAYLPLATQTALGNNCATNPNCNSDGSNTFKVSEWYDSPNRVRQTNNVTRALSIATGIDGILFGDYAWNLHYSHGENRLSTTGIHNGNNQFHDAAQDAVIDGGVLKCWNNTAAAIAQFGDLYPGCVPINPFGNNVSTQQQIDYWGRNTHFNESNKMDDIAASISGDIFNLPAGPIRGALNAEMRWLDYSIDSNASPTAVVNCFGLRLCGALGTGTTAAPHTAQQPGSGFISTANQQYVTQTLWDNNTVPSVKAVESVWEFSGEIGIPILKDLPFIQHLDADIAGRYTDYSIGGAVQTWKVGLDWHVNDDVRFRGTTSVDIRAPTLNDLYSPTVSNSGPFLDPLTNFNPGGIQTRSGGNPNLVPETARTYTAGVVLTPTFIPGLTISADYYSINLHNAITSISGATAAIANLCIASVGTSPFCTLYDRPFPYTNTTTANYPTLLRSQSLNAAFNETEGEDYEIDYGFNAADLLSNLSGQVSLRALLNVAPVNSTSNFSGAPLAHTVQPKGHATLFAGYTLGNWSMTTQWHWFSDLHKNGIVQPCVVNTLADATGSTGNVNFSLVGQCKGATFYAQNRVPGFSTTDFTLTRKFTLDNGTAMSAYFNVQNAFNSIPPDVTGSSGNPGGISVPQGEDLMGRYFTIGIRGNL